MSLRAVLALTAVAMLATTGCTATGPTAEPTPTPTTVPTLSDPIELDSLSSVVVDDGVGRALITDWNAQKVRVIDATGAELWSRDTPIDDERGGAEAYSAGENVIIHDYSGTTTAYAWSDGSEQWSYTVPGDEGSCHPATGFGSQTTGVSPNLGEGDLILLTYLGMEDPGCEPTSSEGNLMVVALDPRTGKEAWPALSVGEDSRTFGGTPVNISPDRSTGYLSWDDGGTSALSRIDLSSGKHSTISLEAARTVDDTGVDYYDVRPTTDPASALYVYGAEDPDDPMSTAVKRTAVLDLPATPPQSSDPVMAVADTKGSDVQGSGTQSSGTQAEATMEDIFDPVCAAELAFTPQGEPTCLQPQLYAAAIKYQGSTGGLKAWTADAPETALDSIGFPGAPQTAPVDGLDGPLVIVPGLRKAVDALDARTGKTVWSAGDTRTPAAPAAEDDAQFGMPWGGQGVLPDLGLVVVTDAGATRFFAAATGRQVSEEPASEFAALSSSRRFVLVSDEDSTTMWAVVDR